MIAKIKFIFIGLLKGSYFFRYLFLKPYMKMLGFIALLNGSYNIGMYDGMLSKASSITVLPLTKIQTFLIVNI